MWAVIGACVVAGCQKPTDPSDVIDFDEVVDVTVTPNPIQADTQTGGRTYRVVRGNNQPDDILPYDWHTDRKSTRLNSSHGYISYAVFCLKKKKKTKNKK